MTTTPSTPAETRASRRAAAAQVAKGVAPAHPWRRTARTVLAAFLVLAPAWPVIVESLEIPQGQYPQLVAILTGIGAALGAVTRVLAIPVVNLYLGKVTKWLAAEEVEADKVSRVVVEGKVFAGGASHLPTGTELDAAA